MSVSDLPQLMHGIMKTVSHNLCHIVQLVQWPEESEDASFQSIHITSVKLAIINMV